MYRGVRGKPRVRLKTPRHGRGRNCPQSHLTGCKHGGARQCLAIKCACLVQTALHQALDILHQGGEMALAAPRVLQLSLLFQVTYEGSTGFGQIFSARSAYVLSPLFLQKTGNGALQ